ncbi:MAG: hypothetical protein KI790_07860 [Cyclobacteriaceae bacterium]|nr:hypothetical protein [Cyclobacteriaceae bacterium HetDA_MAG_MS6]
MSSRYNYWIVDCENPWPDKYITVLADTDSRADNSPNRRVFRKAHEAMEHAESLLPQFGLKQVRVFYPSETSEIINY